MSGQELVESINVLNDRPSNTCCFSIDLSDVMNASVPMDSTSFSSLPFFMPFQPREVEV
jgi:hypothetical protein